MPQIFISYRREDSQGIAGRINEHLERRFSSTAVTFDVKDIPAGSDWRTELQSRIQKSDIIVVIIGPKWETIADDKKNKRLHNPDDMVRYEIAEGLRQRTKLIIPVLVDGAKMPKEADLPPDLRGLARLQAIEIRSGNPFDRDMKAVIKAIEPRPRIDWKWIAAIAAVVLVAIAALVIVPRLLTPNPVFSRYSFEDGTTMGWKCQDIPTDNPDFDTQACVSAAYSTEQVHEGSGALKLMMDLIGGSATQSKGEAFVELLGPPQNLTGKTVSIWVYPPKDAAGSGPLNGFQVFVKNGQNQKFASEYGCWFNIPRNQEEVWAEITLTVSATVPTCSESSGFMATGFDPTQVKFIGIKMGAAGGSTAAYSGPIYIDEVDALEVKDDQ